MNQNRQVSLIQMEAGQRGIVVEVVGGRGLVARLAAMGIRPGRKISKLSAMFLRGPVTIQVDHSQLAIAFGIARRITVELEED